MLDIINCPICKTQSLTAFKNCEDFTVSHETFSVKVCNKCTLAVTTPRPEDYKLGDYYKSEEYISHSGKTSGGIGTLYKTARSFSLTWKVRLVEKFAQKGTALDFGCGTGEFLDSLQKANWQIAGVEPSTPARTKAERITNKKIHSVIHEISNEQFDVISAWHVLEHVPDLENTVRKIKALLKKDGTIFIAVPNYESPDAKQYGNYWAAYDVPRHLWHFSKKSMNELMISNGLNIIDIQPMKLDSFYVSMLSEKYQGSKSPLKNLFFGFISGLRSNLNAQKNNYSSLIYIIKHA